MIIKELSGMPNIEIGVEEKWTNKKILRSVEINENK